MALQNSFKFSAAEFTSDDAYALIERGQFNKIRMLIYRNKEVRDTAGAGAEPYSAKVTLTEAEEDAIWTVLYGAIKRSDSMFKNWEDTDPK